MHSRESDGFVRVFFCANVCASFVDSNGFCRDRRFERVVDSLRGSRIVIAYDVFRTISVGGLGSAMRRESGQTTVCARCRSQTNVDGRAEQLPEFLFVRPHDDSSVVVGGVREIAPENRCSSHIKLRMLD